MQTYQMRKVPKGQFLRSEKMKDFEFIREFGKIKITDCCKSVKVDMSNIYNKKTTLENAKKVREEIEDRIARLYLKGNKENGN